MKTTFANLITTLKYLDIEDNKLIKYVTKLLQINLIILSHFVTIIYFIKGCYVKINNTFFNYFDIDSKNKTCYFKTSFYNISKILYKEIYKSIYIQLIELL